MKTIEITDEMFDKLTELSKEMLSQNKRGTAMPHMFQIREDKKVYDTGMNGDFSFFHDDEYNEIEGEELKDYIIENSTLSKSKVNKMDEDEIDDWINENTNLTECSYSIEPEYKNTFFTAKECDEHIRKNHYHYVNPVSYLNHAWRNPEMELISKFLCELTGGKIHK